MSGVISNTIVTDGLILYYDGANPKSYVSGDTVSNDLSITQSNGTLENGVTYDTDNNGSWVFDGIDDYIEIGNNENFSFGDGANDFPFSFSCWVNMTDVTRFRILSKRSEPTNKEYAMYLSGADTLVFIIEDKSTFGYEYIVTTNNFTSLEGEWVNITGTYSGIGGSNARNGLELYINKEIQTVTRGFNPGYIAMENTAQPVQFGRYDTSYANGKISVVKIYNRELTQGEITQNYNAMKSRFGL